MRNTFKKLLAGLTGAGLLLGTMAPVSASAGSFMPSAPAASNENVQHVQDRRHWRGGPRHGWDRPRRGWDRPRHGGGYWNDYRGYRYYRHGYRRHNDGWWYPLAAFGAGAIIGGAIASPPPPVYRVPAYGNSHVQWCYNRYRSYRASDNTFQPYNGPRQQCYSPYGR